MQPLAYFDHQQFKEIFSNSPVLFIDKNTWVKYSSLQFDANYDLNKTASTITKVNDLLNKKELITVLTIPAVADSSIFNIDASLMPDFGIRKSYAVVLIDSTLEDSTIQKLKILGFKATGKVEDFFHSCYMSQFSHDNLNDFITDLNEVRHKKNRTLLMLKL